MMALVWLLPLDLGSFWDAPTFLPTALGVLRRSQQWGRNVGAAPQAPVFALEMSLSPPQPRPLPQQRTTLS